MPHTLKVQGTLDLLDLHAHDPRRYPYLLQSVARDNSQARFDILFAFPGEQIRLDKLDDADFLSTLDQQWREQGREDHALDELPFRGGWFLYLGYELAAQIEPSLRLKTLDDGLPVACATRVPAAIIVDHQRQETTLLVEAGQANLLALMQADIDTAEPFTMAATPFLKLSEDPPEQYTQGVRRIHDYIVEGDVFQVNLSRTWRAEMDSPFKPADHYARLRQQNPGAFAGLACLDEAAVISSSPERLVRVASGLAETRPIAGTRPRGESEADVALQSELLAHPKERAEHIMLIDLERNDLGRVCQAGSVKVDELMVLESYAHVHHIVSNVSGQLREGITPGEVIKAVFPGGTITGCPKVRCMEIIAELEDEGRGAYTGSMGYLNHNGDMDLNILIRTLVQNSRGVSLRAGAGIVADSDPEKELDETRAKAKGLLLALGTGPE